MPHSDIHFEQIASAGLITLDRLDALNALSMDMVLAFTAQLSRWASDNAITHVVLCSSSPRAFCAGGDIKYARQLAVSGDPAGSPETASWRAYFMSPPAQNARGDELHNTTCVIALSLAQRDS